MLSRIRINGKSIPVPVPLHTLDAAIRWAEDTLAVNGKIITKIVLDGNQVLSPSRDSNLSSPTNLILTSSSVLELNMETADELLVQSLDTIRHLSTITIDSLKPIAVELWQLESELPPKQLRTICDDLSLISEVLINFREFPSNSELDISPIPGVGSLIAAATEKLTIQIRNRHWREAASTLLNRIEKYLRDALEECDKILILKLRSNASINQTPLERTFQQPKTY